MGPDGISAWFLKEIAADQEVVDPLTMLTINLRKLAVDWKQCNVTPVHKGVRLVFRVTTVQFQLLQRYWKKWLPSNYAPIL